MDPDKEFEKLLATFADDAETVAAIKSLVVMVSTYYNGLIDGGMDENPAMALTMSYQSDMLRNAMLMMNESDNDDS